MLVLAANLQQVEEVGGGGVNGNQVFVIFWRGVWEGLDLQVLRSLRLSIGTVATMVGILP